MLLGSENELVTPVPGAAVLPAAQLSWLLHLQGSGLLRGRGCWEIRVGTGTPSGLPDSRVGLPGPVATWLPENRLGW